VNPYRIRRRVFLLGAAALGGVIAYARYVEPYWISLERLTLTLPRLAPAFEGYRIVQISDLHMDGWMTPERIERVVELVNEQQPDLVAITGDYVSVSPDYVSGLPKPLRRLQAPDGVVAILGNHDHLNDAAAVRSALSSAGATDLSNTVHTLRRGSAGDSAGAALHLCGIDSVMEGLDRLDEVIEALDDAEPGCAVLLAHEPDFADESAAAGRFDLQLSGHSHGGQVRIPFLKTPYIVPILSRLGFSFAPPLIYEYPSGLYKVGKMYQYTNRGLGVVYARFRLNCRPEITTLTLRAP
jgi:hypothetical protein